ncbi:MAG: hypothetical protein CMQ43_12005 [Gammaproteobacteria bacterium]|nr:hypothetical protein [Gammaproteobacteria bacterium]MBK81620.1 hypothetical protein [Gammaproteobacteria bacterium]|tara:strand:- start:1411 stop:2082 length:672 start_codon:yes stop_codon:yes gene_type:complete
MPDMPGHVARPRFLELSDDYLNQSIETRRRFAAALLAGDPLAGIYRQLRIGTAADWRHLEREFYAEDGPLAYWPYNRYGYLGNKQEILRQGVLEAIRVAERLPDTSMTRSHFAKPLPPDPVGRRIETWWICSGMHFEINVCDGDAQTTMILLTPAMPFLPDSRKPKLEQDGFIWTVGHKNQLEFYLSEYRKDQDRYPTLKKAYKTGGSAKERKDLRRLEKFQD